MLLVSNGAQKSGSTWLYNILTSLKTCESPDPHFLTGNSKNPCIKPGMLQAFLESDDIKSSTYITKNHLGNPVYRDILLANPYVFVFDIERDPKDVAVSLYYDECNRHGYKKSFKKFYWTFGREKVSELSAYHSLWRNSGPRSFVASFERLKTCFPDEVRAIARVLAIDLADDDVQTLQEKTSIEALRKKYSDQDLYKGEQFFRKGIVGDWKNHFDERMLEDIDKITVRGFRPLDWRHLSIRFKRRLCL